MTDDLQLHLDTQSNGAATLTVAGEIDLHTAAQFHRALTQAATSHPRLCVDLTATAYLDSAGIAALFDAARHTALELVLGPGCLIARAIEVSQLDQVATIAIRK